MKPTSSILKAIAENGTEKITIGDLRKEAGSRAHGFGLFVFALPETLPLPTPSLSTVLAVPLILISAHLIIFGEGSRIPGRKRRFAIRTSTFQNVVRYVSPVLKQIERLSKPRLETLVQRERMLGSICLLLSLVLALPIPLANFAPAVCLAAIAFGMLQRDGVIIAIGLIGAAAVVFSLYLAADKIAAFLAKSITIFGR
jgi:hypothetical protein